MIPGVQKKTYKTKVGKALKTVRLVQKILVLIQCICKEESEAYKLAKSVNTAINRLERSRSIRSILVAIHLFTRESFTKFSLSSSRHNLHHFLFTRLKSFSLRKHLRHQFLNSFIHTNTATLILALVPTNGWQNTKSFTLKPLFLTAFYIRVSINSATEP